MAASGLIALGMWALEVGRGAWWYLAWVDTPYPSGRNPWTSGTVRGQKRGGGCCRPREPLPSGRTRPRRAPTASRSTSPKRRLDSEHRTVVCPSPPPHSTPTPFRPAPSFGSSAGRCCLSAGRPSAFPLVQLTTTANANILLIQQAMTAILVS